MISSNLNNSFPGSLTQKYAFNSLREVLSPSSFSFTQGQERTCSVPDPMLRAAGMEMNKARLQLSQSSQSKEEHKETEDKLGKA